MSLIEQIRAAFATVGYPGDEFLSDSTYGEEPEALRIEFRGKDRWEDLDASFLDQAPDGWGSALSFFSPPALHFYLPAYLIADLEGKLEHQEPTSRLCAFLTPQMASKRLAKIYGGGTLGEHARETFSRFDAPQVSAIVAYLWWKLEVGLADLIVEQALEAYWLPREAELQLPGPRREGSAPGERSEDEPS